MALAMGLCGQRAYGQETQGDFRIKSPFHNQLFFNRFLINPTFSLVSVMVLVHCARRWPAAGAFRPRPARPINWMNWPS